MENVMENADAGTLKSTHVMGVEHITNESLRQGAQELLESYYEKRDALAGQIAIYEEALVSAKEELRLLNKKNRKLLKQTGEYKTQDERLYDIIKDNPGLLHGELFQKAKLDNTFAYLELGHFTVLLRLLYNSIQQTDGLYYAKKYEKTGAKGFSPIVIQALKDGPKSRRGIVEFAEKQGNFININSLGPIIRNFLTSGRITTNKVYKGQQKIVYTWIGE